VKYCNRSCRALRDSGACQGAHIDIIHLGCELLSPRTDAAPPGREMMRLHWAAKIVNASYRACSRALHYLVCGAALDHYTCSRIC
jgi:hypothetical protein